MENDHKMMVHITISVFYNSHSLHKNVLVVRFKNIWLIKLTTGETGIKKYNSNFRAAAFLWYNERLTTSGFV